MKVKYIGRYEGVRVPDADDAYVTNGETVEVSEAVGRSLLEQPTNWEQVGGRKGKSPEDESGEDSE